MGTTPYKKKLTTPSKHPAYLLSTETLETATASVHEQADQYEGVLAKIKADMVCPQNVMRMARQAGLLGDETTRIAGAFKTFALNHRRGDGGFMHTAEAGRPLLIVGFPVGGGAVSPKWKDEAFELAKELAAVRGEEFDADAFEAAVRAKYKPGAVTTSVRLEEAS